MNESTKDNLMETTSNCLALAIRNDYKLTSISNVISQTLKMGLRVAISDITLFLMLLFL